MLPSIQKNLMEIFQTGSENGGDIMVEKNTLTLDASERSLRKKKVGKLRREGIIPGIVHGKDFDQLFVQVDEREFDKVYRKSHGSAIVSLNLKGKPIQVLIHATQKDKLSYRVKHVEFLKIDMNRDVTVDVPLVFIGMSPGEKEGKGKVTHEETSIHLKCSPTSIPSEIQVDVSVIIDKHDIIHASDLKLPEGVSLAHGVSEKKVIASLVTGKIAEAAPAEEGVAVPGAEVPAEG
jgi:large subunit ribosomal protein L25